jgi:sulfur carrier protein
VVPWAAGLISSRSGDPSRGIAPFPHARTDDIVPRITVNDEPRDVAAGATVADLLAALELRSRFVAVERNRELVPRTRHSECALEEGDAIEVVTLVGGG